MRNVNFSIPNTNLAPSDFVFRKCTCSLSEWRVSYTDPVCYFKPLSYCFEETIGFDVCKASSVASNQTS